MQLSEIARKQNLPAKFLTVILSQMRRAGLVETMRGREGGTLDEMRASMWVAEQYRRIGLQPAGDDGTWFQWFNIIRTRVSLTSSRATIAGQSLTLFGDIIPLSAVPVEATGPVLWLADPTDTTTEDDTGSDDEMGY